MASTSEDLWRESERGPGPRDSRALALVLLAAVIAVCAVPAAYVVYALTWTPSPGDGYSPPGTKPVLTFGNPATSGGSTTIAIAGVSQAVSRDNYRVNLRVGTVTGTAVALSAAGTVSNVVVSGTTYTITWIDIGGEATVNAGDAFQITTSGGLPAATAFVFYLLWSDGSQIQSASWSTA